jgi:hypothetical protein
MSFKQIHNEGSMARGLGRSLRENPYYQSENLPVSESAAAYRAWQMKAEAWEQGWRERDQALESTPRPVPRRAPQLLLSVDRRAIPLSQRVQDAPRAQEADLLHKTAGGAAA